MSEIKHIERCRKEATRDVIFLLQSRQLIITETGEYFYDSDTQSILSDSGQKLSKAEALNRGIACEVWTTESVWLDRDESELWGEHHSYRFGKGRKNLDWRVYGICAEGQLAQMLQGGAE